MRVNMLLLLSVTGAESAAGPSNTESAARPCCNIKVQVIGYAKHELSTEVP